MRHTLWPFLLRRFLGGLIFFHSRFLSYPPGSLVSYLPILSQQSPKHTNGPAVFCLVLAACFGVEWLRLLDRRRAVTLVLLTLAALLSSLIIVVRFMSGY